MRLCKYYLQQIQMKADYTQLPVELIKTQTREIGIFNIEGVNIDKRVVNEFGEEWLKFNDFSDKTIDSIAAEYFDIINDKMVNKNTYALDIGCGTGRFTKYLSTKAGFIEAVDPSNAIFAADKLLTNVENVRLSRASVETLPFPDETFDFAMSIGVLHHIPNTLKAMQDCIKKVKKGGYFYVYLYYNLDKSGKLFKFLFSLTNVLRTGVSKLPGILKKLTCDILAVILYMPFVLWVRFLIFLGFKNIAKKMPLYAYNNMPFFVIRNDALDRFGTRLEQRFSEKEVRQMMTDSGLNDIVISNGVPYYHAVGKKI